MTKISFLTKILTPSRYLCLPSSSSQTLCFNSSAPSGASIQTAKGLRLASVNTTVGILLLAGGVNFSKSSKFWSRTNILRLALGRASIILAMAVKLQIESPHQSSVRANTLSLAEIEESSLLSAPESSKVW